MLTRNLDKAREAWKSKDVEKSAQAHLNGSATEKHKSGGESIKSAVYGGLDGTITTFAVVAGVAGAELSAGVALILGFANLFADGLSMAIGDYLSTRSEKEYQAAERHREEWEVDNCPEGEKLELIELYESKGLSHDDAVQVVNIFSKNKKVWVDVMMVEELGILEDNEHPLKSALVTFTSFVAFGFLPLISFVLAELIPGLKAHTFPLAVGITGFTLFLLGSLKTRFTDIAWWKSGFEMLLVGGIAATAAYLIGIFLKGFA
jgi:VIT1/CCC1 family predicted Fe2+/Mn2+ transporter